MSLNNKFLDFSQFKEWLFCELSWHEKYRLETRKAPQGQQYDALTLGSLVHEGLRNYRLNNKCVVPESAIDEYNPTPECLAWAQELLLGYFRAYPDEGFTRYYCEEALRFPVLEGFDGLAKIDSYFRLDTPRTINSGLGDTFVLEPGLWIHEYKTKAASRDVGKYIASWSMNMQASFQILALQHALQEQVKGVFVNVLEKPKEYQPKRSCKACKTQSELRDWEPSGSSYKCPVCGNIQDLDTSDKTKTKRVPVFYRLPVTRTADELECARLEIAQVAREMEAVDAGQKVLVRNTDKCADTGYGACAYFEPHRALQTAEQWPGFVKVDSIRYTKI